jgi:acetyl-CoA carboxylase biotin carboxyl carrier protein
MAAGRSGRDDHAAIRRLADELLPALMARLEASTVGELEVRQDGWRVRLRKPAEAATEPSPSPRPTTSRGDVQGRRPAGRDEAHQRTDPPRRVVTSPAVGTFHPAGGAGVGRAVRAGDVVGHVEVLGVPQEVLAPFDGMLGRLLVEGGQIVEYGEPLMRIESAAREAGSEGAGVDPTGTR